MIELRENRLEFRFPEAHADARLTIEFQRTLRIPDDGRQYPLPPGLGRFPLRHVDDFAREVPERWQQRGGVMLPMYQSEALWIRFFTAGYPFAVQVAAGKIDAVSGKPFAPELRRRPQNYVVAPEQPWLDGYCVRKGVIRQFVAMPLGSGYSAEEQLTGAAEHGGLQLQVFPLKAELYKPPRFARARLARMCQSAAPDMGLAPGGEMRQQIYKDTYRLEDWETSVSSRCFVHIANSLVWQALTGSPPPSVPPTAKQYAQAGLPWFDYYDETPAVVGSQELAELKSVVQLGAEKGDNPLPENDSVTAENVIPLRRGLKPGQVREGTF